MSTIIEFFKSNQKILVEIAICKLFEGFFILLGACFLVKFIEIPAQSFLFATFSFFSGRFILSGLTEKFFAKLSIKLQNSFRKQIHEQIFIKETQSGELLTLIFDTLKAREHAESDKRYGNENTDSAFPDEFDLIG